MTGIVGVTRISIGPGESRQFSCNIPTTPDEARDLARLEIDLDVDSMVTPFPFKWEKHLHKYPFVWHPETNPPSWLYGERYQ